MILGILCLSLSAKAAAQSSNRWLFVFNTSAAMRDRTNGMQSITEDLLSTAMHGTIRAGDTIGIWTYSTELHADEAPLQTWQPNVAPGISYNTLLFLRQHAYQSTAAFADVMANILRVIKISDVITVVLISDGSDAVKGTPFDERIAAYYKTNYSPQKKAHMPIVTVIRGEKGVITTNTLSLAPWPVDIPAVPPPPIVTATAKKPEAAAPPAPAPPKPVPSLVIIGKKAETTFNVPTDLPDHSGELPAQPAAVALPAATAPAELKPEAAATPAPETAPAPKTDAKPTPAPAVVANPPVTAPAPAPNTAAEAPKPAQPTQPIMATAPEPKEPIAAKTSETPKVEASAAAPQKELFSGRNIGIVSVVFTLLVCTLLILSARSARRSARASLITRSLDRDRE